MMAEMQNGKRGGAFTEQQKRKIKGHHKGVRDER